MFVYALLNMDNLTKHRKDRLRALIEGKPYAGNQAEFGRKAGLTKARITQLLNPDEPFGERAAERLCAKLELSPRWFEQGLATGEGEMLSAGRVEASNVAPVMTCEARTEALLAELQSIVEKLAPVLQEPGRAALLKWVQGQASAQATAATLQAYEQASKALPQAPAAVSETPIRKPSTHD